MKALALACLALGLGFSPRLQGGTSQFGPHVRPEVEGFVDSAEAGLDLALPCLEDDGLERTIAFALMRGVKVRLLLSPRFKANRMAASRLKAPGLKLRWLDSNARLGLVDSCRVLLGSFNGIPDSLDNKLESLSIEDDLQTAQAFEKDFDRSWAVAEQALPVSMQLGDQLDALPPPQDTQPHVKTTRRKL